MKRLNTLRNTIMERVSWGRGISSGVQGAIKTRRKVECDAWKPRGAGGAQDCGSPLDVPDQAASDSLSFPRITCQEAASPLSYRTLSGSHTTLLAVLGAESWLVSPQKVCSKLWSLCEFPVAAATNDHKRVLAWVMSSQALAFWLLLNGYVSHTDMVSW